MDPAEALRPCILIPTYGNVETVGDVARRALATGLDVLVVDDGSTDGTAEVLAGIEGIGVRRHERNLGKGEALRTGFRWAQEAGYTHAIALDSDGQHAPEDVPRFLEVLRERPEALVIGERDLTAAGAGKRSHFGLRCSNFWATVVTGRRLRDTQSGYRAYPLEAVQALALGTRGFTFEIEVLVKAAWSGVPIELVPIRVYYPPGDERITHFRPIRDFARIGVLYTHLCTLRVGLPAPYLALLVQKRFRALPFSERIRRSVRSLLLEGHGSPLRIASSVALGLFMGVTPFWGFQIPLTLLLAHAWGASKTIAVLAAHVSFPVMIPPILYASLVLGRFLLGDAPGEVASLELEGADVSRWIVGSFALGALVASVGFLLSLALLVGARRSIEAWKEA